MMKHAAMQIADFTALLCRVLHCRFPEQFRVLPFEKWVLMLNRGMTWKQVVLTFLLEVHRRFPDVEVPFVKVLAGAWGSFCVEEAQKDVDKYKNGFFGVDEHCGVGFRAPLAEFCTMVLTYGPLDEDCATLTFSESNHGSNPEVLSRQLAVCETKLADSERDLELMSSRWKESESALAFVKKVCEECKRTVVATDANIQEAQGFLNGSKKRKPEAETDDCDSSCMAKMRLSLERHWAEGREYMIDVGERTCKALPYDGCKSMRLLRTLRESRKRY